MVTITESGQLKTLEKEQPLSSFSLQNSLSLKTRSPLTCAPPRRTIATTTTTRSAGDTMEDDDEIHSQPSPTSGSPPASPNPNGRITVTVAAAAPPPEQPNNNNALALAFPIAPPRNGGGGGGREDCWSEGATAVLIEAWGERYLELSRGNLKQKHWKEVAEIVSRRGGEDHTKPPKTDIQCKNRIDTVKKKYKSEKSKIAAGGGVSKWPFYDRLDHLIGPTAKIPTASASPAQVKAVPVGIPVGIKPVAHYHPPYKLQKLNNPKQKILLRRSNSDSSPDNSPDSTDSFPPEPPYDRKRPAVHQMNSMSGARRVAGGGEKAVPDKNWGNSVRELTRAILKFGEAYEQAESSKLQQVVEMEKQRMKFAKELELQRMQFFMKTKLEISQLKHAKRVANNNSNHRSNIGNNKNNNNSNNSDSSN